jgi:hypothetical protein
MASRRKSRRGRTISSGASGASELERLEDLLDEDFGSLKEARAAYKAETGVAPGKDEYTVRELSSKKNRTVREFIADLSGRTEEIDALKKPNEYWAAEIYGHGTYNLYGSIEQLTRKLDTYKGLQQENPQKALKNIKLIRVSGRNARAEYFKQKKLQVEESWRLAKLKGKQNRKRQRAQEAKLRRSASKIKGLSKQIKALKAKLKRKK